MKNREWAQILIKELIQQKIRYFSIAPGARNTSLVMAIAKHPLAQTSVHFDERGAAFQALGYAKASNTPAAIVVTSGSALGHLMPAVMEAYHSEIPLLVLSADRPPELQETGSNQTCDQVKFFGSYVNRSISLPCPDASLSSQYLKSLASEIAHTTMWPRKGPVHLNCAFRKPLMESPDESFIDSPFKRRQYLPKYTLGNDLYEEIATTLSRFDKGLILLGELPPTQSIDPFITLSRRLQWPIIPDILSNARNFGPNPHFIKHIDALLNSEKDLDSLKPDALLHFGGSFVSTKILEMLKQFPPQKYLHISDKSKRFDPLHLIQERIYIPPLEFAQNLSDHLPGHPSSDYMEMWKEASLQAENNYASYFNKNQNLTNISLTRFLSESLSENDAFFVGNSLSIRNCDHFFYPQKGIGPLFANRGLSGIDGHIATSVGMADALKKRLFVLMGDQTFLHDLNSLALVKKSLPITFIIMNNGGGGIFKHLPIREEKEHFETYFANSHQMDFSAIAQQFGLQYYHPQNLAETENVLSFEVPKNAPSIVEIPIDCEVAFEEHTRALSRLKGCFKKYAFPRYAKL